MTNEQALEWFKSRYDKAKDYFDEHWEAEERRQHEEYVEALDCAIKALTENAELKSMLETVANDIEIAADNMKQDCNAKCAGCLFYNDGKDECAYAHMNAIKNLIGGEDNAV